MIKSIEKILASNIATPIISILIGLGLASIFRKACINDDCYTFKGPYTSEIEENIYSFDGKCYKFTPKNIKCKTKQQQINFA